MGAKVQSKAQARAGARRAPTAEALRNMMLDSDMRDSTIEGAPPQAIQMIAEAKVRSNPHRAWTKKGYTTEVAPPQSEAKVRFTPHRARTKEDDTTEAEAGAQARAAAKKAPSAARKETTEEFRARARKSIVGAARRAGPSTEESNKAVKDNTMGRSLRNKKAARAQVAPPQAVAKARSTPHRARTKEDKTTEVAPSGKKKKGNEEVIQGAVGKKEGKQKKGNEEVIQGAVGKKEGKQEGQRGSDTGCGGQKGGKTEEG